MLRNFFMKKIKINIFSLILLIGLSIFLSIAFFKYTETPEQRYYQTVHEFSEQINNLNKELINPDGSYNCNPVLIAKWNSLNLDLEKAKNLSGNPQSALALKIVVGEINQDWRIQCTKNTLVSK